MSATRIVRPVVRSFKAKYALEAGRHVRAGGHAIVWDTPSRARLVFQEPDGDDPDDLGAWAVYDLAKWKWTVIRSGHLKGLAEIKVPRDCHDIIQRRIHRDSIHPKATKSLRLDCTRCAACCRSNEVLLEPGDYERFEEGGRPELSKRPYARRRADGRVVLVLQRDRRCKHLRRDNRCGIYAIRPNACSEFPAGSECCMSARWEELREIDGLHPDHA